MFYIYFQYVYLYSCNKNLEDFSVNGDEIGRLVEVDLQDALDLFYKEKEDILAREKYFLNNKYIIEEKRINLKNFMTCYQIIDEFFKRMLIAAKRYCDGEDPKYIMW